MEGVVHVVVLVELQLSSSGPFIQQEVRYSVTSPYEF